MRRQLAGGAVKAVPCNCCSGSTSHRRNSTRRRSPERSARPVVSAWAPITRQSWKRGAWAAASGVWMKAARSTGRNRPEERRLFSTTPAMSRPSRCASPVPAKSGTAIGIGFGAGAGDVDHRASLGARRARREAGGDEARGGGGGAERGAAVQQRMSRLRSSLDEAPGIEAEGGRHERRQLRGRHLQRVALRAKAGRGAPIRRPSGRALRRARCSPAGRCGRCPGHRVAPAVPPRSPTDWARPRRRSSTR